MGTAARQRGLAFTTRQLLVAILFVAIFAMAFRQPADTDTWWHLKSGQLMWEGGEILRVDPFSHTAQGQPWIYPRLVEIIYWPVYQAFGLAGLAILVAALVTASFALVYTQCRGKPFVAAFVTLVGAIASSVIWAARPQIVSLLLTATVAFLLDRHKRSGVSVWLWPLPPLVALWVNCHGGFVIAFILMGCYLIGEALNRLTLPAGTSSASSHSRSGRAKLAPLAIVTLVSIPAVLLNPNTVQMFPYAFQTIGIKQLQDFIQEWASPNFHNLRFHPFIWLLLLTLVAMGLSRRRVDWTDLVLVGVFAYMGLLAARNIALFALVAPPVLSRHTVFAIDDMVTAQPRLSPLAALTHTLRPPPPRRVLVLLNLLLLVLVLIGAGVRVTTEAQRLRDPGVWGEGLPLEAVEYLRDHDPPGLMFNSYNWGGYLIWSLYPDMLVFIDGRTDLYALNGTVLEDYAQVHWARPGWEEILNRYEIGYVITERTGLLDLMLAREAGWTTVHQDDLAVIYQRAETGP